METVGAILAVVAVCGCRNPSSIPLERSEETWSSPSPPPGHRQLPPFVPLTPCPGKPQDINVDSLWQVVAKVDPPKDWLKVITPESRQDFPARFTLDVSTNGATATFQFVYSETNPRDMLHHIELFEPDPAILDSPRADRGLVQIQLQTHSHKGEDIVTYHVDFTYPIDRLPRTYLRVVTSQNKPWPISLSAFLKTATAAPANRTEKKTEKEVKIDIGGI